MSLDHYNGLMLACLSARPMPLTWADRSSSSGRARWPSARCSMAERLAWTREAWADYLYWQSQIVEHAHKPAGARQPGDLPLRVLANPRPLSIAWSRRIDRVNRLVYAVDGEVLTIILLLVPLY